MINAIYGKKIGMTQIFNEDDQVVPVTIIVAEPNKVCQVKTAATDGYEAVQLGFGAIKPKKITKPMGGHFAKLGTEPVRYLREVRVENASEYKTGDLQTVAAFADVRRSTLPALPRVKASLALSSATASLAALADTVLTSIALPAPSASAPRLPASSRAFAFRVTWAATPLP